MSGERTIITTNLPRHLRAYAQTQIDRVLAPFAGGFDTVEVAMTGGRNSGNVRCEIKVRLAPSGIRIIQESRDDNANTAIHNAAEAVARAMSRLRTVRSTPPLTTAA